MPRSQKRARRSEGHLANTARAAPKTHDWEKDDEELELEARLFGASKKRSNGHVALTAQIGRDETDETAEEMREMADDEVSVDTLALKFNVSVVHNTFAKWSIRTAP